MNFFGKNIPVTNIDGRFFVNLNGVLPTEVITEHSYSVGFPLDNVLPLLGLLEDTGWDGLCKRELVKHVVYHRTMVEKDMIIPTIVDVDLGKRMRVSTYTEDDETWVCAVQLEQISVGIHYDLRVAESLLPSQLQYIHIPFRPRLVWQNDKEMVIYFIPLSHVDQYFKTLRSDFNAHYVDQHVGKIQEKITTTLKEMSKWM
jgi:hypothetical protein